MRDLLLYLSSGRANRPRPRTPPAIDPSDLRGLVATRNCGKKSRVAGEKRLGVGKDWLWPFLRHPHERSPGMAGFLAKSSARRAMDAEQPGGGPSSPWRRR